MFCFTVLNQLNVTPAYRARGAKKQKASKKPLYFSSLQNVTHNVFGIRETHKVPGSMIGETFRTRNKGTLCENNKNSFHHLFSWHATHVIHKNQRVWKKKEEENNYYD